MDQNHNTYVGSPCSADGFQTTSWKCAGCGTVNTGETCQNAGCGIGRQDSVRIYQERAEKNAKRQSRGNFLMSFIGILLILVALGALGYFVAWPYLVMPHLETSELNTPEMVQSYYGSSDTQGQIIFTVTSCTPDGKVYGDYEFFRDSAYCRVKLEGQISKKKHSGDLTITWDSQTVDVEAPGIPWVPVGETTITHQFENVQFGEISLCSIHDFTVIKTAGELKALNGSRGKFLLGADLDLKDIAFTPIRDFSGTLLGGGHIIQNLHIDASGSDIGFFSNLEGTVINLDFQDATVLSRGSCENIGILCGKLTGFAANISVSGEVTAENGTNVGGIIGALSKESPETFMVPKLSSNAHVTGEKSVGGIIGSLQNTGITLLDRCKNTGSVSGDTRVGGICGYAGEASGGIHMINLTNTGKINGNSLVGGLCGELTCNPTLSKEIECSTKKGNKYGNER